MKASTFFGTSGLFYAALNVNAGRGEEQAGLSIGRLYVGLYDGRLCGGFLDQNGCLPGG